MAVSLARVLLESGLLDVTWLGKATAIATEANVPLAHALTRWKLIESRALAQALSRATGLAVVDIESAAAPVVVPMQRQACHRLRVVPLALEATTLTLGMTDPTDDDAVLQVEQALRLRVKRVLVDDDALEQALRRLFPKPGDEIRAPQVAGPARVATKAFSPMVTHGEEVPSQDMAVVLAEPTSLESGWMAENASPEMFLHTPTSTPTPPVPLQSNLFESFEGESSGVFTSKNMELGHTVEMVPPRLAVLAATMNNAPVVAQMTDEAPTLQNDVLGVMRVLVAVDDAAAAEGLVRSFGQRLRELKISAIDKAAYELEKRRFNVVVVVDPKNSIAGSQQVAALAARAKGGVFVVSGIADFARLPGVKLLAPPTRDGDLAKLLEKVIADKVRG
ncbi:MAG: hypothetical protein Q8O67_24415 [Deltaproteobacteria bacterium]|nr:hypothetical protein [Deltaproteobacteria bacterium]